MCVNVNAYVITTRNNNAMELDGTKIVMISDLDIDESVFFIVAVEKENIQHEINKILYTKGVISDNIFF